ncbi:MAG: deoxyribose-phosphate aldolase [Thaumarchaeota archaeon]|nr:deoxyribose-phosphate aldolase [Nitrososphaerota archaeon]
MGDSLVTPDLTARTDLARLIDHTLLRASTTKADVDRLCGDALEYNFWSVCLPPLYVRQAAQRLRGSETRVCAVVGFPLGQSKTEAKLAEAESAIDDGARELDMVADIGALRSGDNEAFYVDISTVADLCQRSNTILKVILECCYLTDEEKIRGARLAERAGANFVKTSTGFGPGGATPADVVLLRKALTKKTGVKAAGGISTLGAALQMLEAGADRIGTSSGVKIMEEALSKSG